MELSLFTWHLHGFPQEENRFHLREAFNDIKQKSVIVPSCGFMGPLLQYKFEILPSMSTPQAPSCQQEAVSSSFIAHFQTLIPNVEGSTARSLPQCCHQCPPTHGSQISRGAHSHSDILLNLGQETSPAPRTTMILFLQPVDIPSYLHSTEDLTVLCCPSGIVRFFPDFGLWHDFYPFILEHFLLHLFSKKLLCHLNRVLQTIGQKSSL